ncbi:arsenate reductase family protein [Litoreibacter roseus]|uniref:Arsenate reductase n=1 Tax=Litoreibacter roseus TaxID=2601869 RepID=A0A6N6JL27_9RHOB|nr:ArsC/Spx/MgsR family protein [Litoreibacter roseus]GFE65892.1 hypothetical protein KIN_29660 [Litoreibacter roseus]
MELYGIKSCDSCRKALKSLERAGHTVTFIDVRAAPLSQDTLSKFHAAFGDALLNTQSTTWRGLNEAERGKDPLALLAAHPTLMKRPVIQADALYLGWGKDVQTALL